MFATHRVGEGLLVAYQDLIQAESRLGEVLSVRGVRLGTSVIDQWPVLHEYLNLYARGLSPAGVLVLGGQPDEASRATGIPFTGAREAHDLLGLALTGTTASPSGAGFWRAVHRAQAAREGAPLESLFGTVHLAHAIPFDVDASPEVRDAGAAHVLRLLRSARPQAAVAVGPVALSTLGRALKDRNVEDFAATPEEQWTARYPAGTGLFAYPTAEVPAERPFRLRIVPVPSFVGEAREDAVAAVESVLTYAWA